MYTHALKCTSLGVYVYGNDSFIYVTFELEEDRFIPITKIAQQMNQSKVFSQINSILLLRYRECFIDLEFREWLIMLRWVKYVVWTFKSSQDPNWTISVPPHFFGVSKHASRLRNLLKKEQWNKRNASCSFLIQKRRIKLRMYHTHNLKSPFFIFWRQALSKAHYTYNL